MEKNYRRSNTYHNSTHAADVTQCASYFLKKLQERGVSGESVQGILVNNPPNRPLYPPSILCVNWLKRLRVDLDNLPNLLIRPIFSEQIVAD